MYITEKNLQRENNNFDLLRLLAALLVFVSHGLGIRGITEIHWFKQVTGTRFLISEFGLFIFFGMSGLLVCRSLVMSCSARQFLKNRFLRIWPALFFCTVVTVVVSGILFTTLPLSAFFTDGQTLNYFFRNISMLSSSHWLPGVFNNTAVNPSIWTIPIEVRLYILLLLVWLVARMRMKQWLLLLLVICWAVMVIVPTRTLYDVLQSHNAKALNLGIYFLMGACFYLYKEKIPLKFSIWLALLVYWLVLLIWFPYYVKKLQHPFFLYSILYIALRWRKIPFIKADLSYSFYLFAAPWQKVIQVYYGDSISHVVYFLITGLGITITAWLSWQLIESKALALKYTQARRKSFDLPQRPENKAYADK
jgi:peptidoglycan/LPS O-acetylase OafA/YrhL